MTCNDNDKISQVKRKFDFKLSVFSRFKKDTEKRKKACFEYDWALSKIPKMINTKNELDFIKKTLYDNFYNRILSLYRYMQSTCRVGDPAQINWLKIHSIFQENLRYDLRLSI